MTALHTLVSEGRYASLALAMDAAIEALIERETAADAWWKETAKRCDNARAHPERLISVDEVFARVRSRVSEQPE